MLVPWQRAGALSVNAAVTYLLLTGFQVAPQGDCFAKHNYFKIELEHSVRGCQWLRKQECLVDALGSISSSHLGLSFFCLGTDWGDSANLLQSRLQGWHPSKHTSFLISEFISMSFMIPMVNSLFNRAWGPGSQQFSLLRSRGTKDGSQSDPCQTEKSSCIGEEHGCRTLDGRGLDHLKGTKRASPGWVTV